MAVAMTRMCAGALRYSSRGARGEKKANNSWSSAFFYVKWPMAEWAQVAVCAFCEMGMR